MIVLMHCMYCKEYFTCCYECGKYGMTLINNIANCACNDCSGIDKVTKKNTCKVKTITNKELIALLI
jgi:hypothetical protein